MPNIIAIVDDNKMRAQLESFFKEMDAEGIRMRSFNTGYEFEQKYFANKKTVKVHPLNQISGFEKFSFEQLEETLALPLAEKPALPHRTLKFKFNGRNQKIEGVEPIVDSNQTVLNRFPEDLGKENNFLAQLVLPAFANNWKKFMTDAASKRTQVLLPLKATEKELGWFKITAQKTTGDLVAFEIEETSDTYREAVKNELARRQAHSKESEELQLLSEIDLVIFKIDCISSKVPKWMDEIWRQMRDGGYFPKEKIPRFVLLKYEDDGISKLDVLHNRLDDLVYLPLDRLIFLQKMEIILSLPKKITPNYLFSQEVGIDIEISKLSKLEKISDLGLVIRNPVRLTNGLLAHFYLTMPGEENPVDLWGKVILSEPHPEREHEFLVYFSFFGVRKSDGIALKQYMAKGTRFQTFIKADREDFLFNPDDLFYSEEERRIKTVAILDLDEASAQQLKSNLPKDIDQLKLVAESNFAGFATRYMSSATQQFAQPPSGAGEGDLFGPQIDLIIQAESQEMTSNLAMPAEGQTYFGHNAIEAFSVPLGWQKPLIAVNGNKELLSELINLASGGRTISRSLLACTANGDGRILHFQAVAGTEPSTVKISLSLPTKEDLQPRSNSDKISNLDLVIVDLALVPGGNINGFMEAFNEQAKNANLLKNSPRIKFILLLENEKQLRHRDWSHPDLIGVVTKPIEMRQLSFLIASALNSKFSIYRMDNLGWMKTLLPIHVAKEVRLEMLSEFGVAIRHIRPIAPGSILYLRGGLFDNAPNKCLAARFYHCEEHSKEKGQFLCTAIYFGINDGFMKYARRWFRETYAHSKQVEGNS